MSWSDRRADTLRALAYFALGWFLLLVVPEIAIDWRPGTELPFWAALAMIGVAALGQTVRRELPSLGLAVGTAALLAGVLGTGETPLGVLLPFGDLLYCAVLFGSRRTSWTVAGLAGTVAVGIGLSALVSEGGRAALLAVLNLGLLLLIPVFWGHEVRQHRERADAERDRVEQTRQIAVAAERTRMARDLHDVIAGQLSGIAIQSEAALSLPDADADALRRVLTAVRRDSVASLNEMRAMIGLLRADGAGDDDPRTAPAGLDDLDRLLETGRATGLRIEVEDRRSTRPVPASVGLAAYRIVQEALTNAAKHAPGSTVRVMIEERADELVVEVANALVPGAPRGDGTGVGLIGLGERATAVGGRFSAAPDGDRWLVRATLPTPVTVA